MKQLFVAAILVSLVACGGGTSDEPLTPTPEVKKTKEQALQALIEGQVTGYIKPAYQGFESQTAHFLTSAKQFCALESPNQTAHNELKQAWLALVQAWQQTKAVRIGPINDEYRSFRVQFWPDTNRAVVRGVETLLAASEINQVLVSQLQDGAQGIPALEYLIYADNQGESLLTADNKQHRCSAVIAIAENVNLIAKEVTSLWFNSNGFAAEIMTPSGQYQSHQQVFEDIITNWFELLEVVADDKISGPLGFTAEGQIEKAEHFRAKGSLASIQGNLLAIERSMNAGGEYSLASYLNDIHQNTEIATQISTSLASIRGKLATFDSIESMISNSEQRQALFNLALEIREFRLFLETDLIQLTGFNPNFNSNDGD